MVDEAVLRMIIRATARTSALCVAFAFARVRTREFLVALPVSHAVHFAAILTLAITTSAGNAHIGISTVGGLAIYALMVFTAFRPRTWAIYLLWIIFIIGFVVRDMSQPVYPGIMAVLLASAVVRFTRATPPLVAR